MPTPQPDNNSPHENNTLIIGISGPSSSGKTTLARLLKNVFSVLNTERNNGEQPSRTKGIQSMIIHEDDFYVPDNHIPVVKTSSGDDIQDWDTIDAIDISFLASSLKYLREHGSLPPELESKEDFNQDAGSGVYIDNAEIERLKGQVKNWVEGHWRNLTSATGTTTTTIAFLEGFLLYSPPQSELSTANTPKHSYVLRPIHQQIHAHLFLPASYDDVKKRREGRSGYATAGPSSSATTQAPTPIPTELPQRNSISEEVEQEVERELQNQDKVQDVPEQKADAASDNNAPANFWVDPPGYVDDIVWPHYVRDHSWLFLSEKGDPINADSMDNTELVRTVGQGTNVRTNAGVTVAPCHGDLPMMDTLKWAVTEVLNAWETKERSTTTIQ